MWREKAIRAFAGLLGVNLAPESRRLPAGAMATDLATLGVGTEGSVGVRDVEWAKTFTLTLPASKRTAKAKPKKPTRKRNSR